jgi:hypothetical protein
VENKRVLELAAAIKKLLLEHRATFLESGSKDFTTLQNGLDIQLPLSRPLWQPSKESHFSTKQLETAVEADSIQALKNLTAIVNTPPISESELETRIEKLLKGVGQISLSEVVQAFPIRFGTFEVLSYLLIATRESQHMIRFDQTEKILCPKQGFTLTVPHVIFTQKPLGQTDIHYNK